MKLILLLTSSIVAILSVTCNPSSSVRTSNIDAADSAMVSAAYQQALFNIRSSEEAITRSTSVKTKELAAKVISSDTRLKDEFEKLSGKKAFQLPLDITNGHLQAWRQLVTRKGWEFDENYLEVIQKSSKLLQGLLVNIRDSSKDAGAKKIVEKFNTAYVSNLDLAGEILQEVKSKIKRDSLNLSITYSK